MLKWVKGLSNLFFYPLCSQSVDDFIGEMIDESLQKVSTYDDGFFYVERIRGLPLSANTAIMATFFFITSLKPFFQRQLK